MIGLDSRRRVSPDDDYRPLIRRTWPDRDVGPLSITRGSREVGLGKHDTV
jgi:hypothetical protein